jgi:hypothetical protein
LIAELCFSSIAFCFGWVFEVGVFEITFDYEENCGIEKCDEFGEAIEHFFLGV